MREIKFRAWSNYEQKYYYNIGLVNGLIYADLGNNYEPTSIRRKLFLEKVVSNLLKKMV